MLTSNNQYLRPEYLTPLPTTLDAKKSPLALLAQTCSQIGADTPNSKLLQSSDKSSKKSDHSKDKPAIPSSDLKAGNFPTSKHQLESPREKSRTPEERSCSSTSANRVRTPSRNGSLKNGQVNGRCGSNQSAASARESPSVSVDRKSPGEESHRSSRSPEKASEGSNSPQTPSGSKTAFTPNILTSSSDPAIKDLPLGTFKPGMPPVSSAFLTTSSYPGFPSGLPMDLMTSSLMSRTSALNPYFSYGRLKTQDSLAVCRDPYCTGCSLNAHLFSAAQKPPCPAGCAQCDHAKIPTSAASYNTAAAAYAHAQLAALVSSHPYVCNWMNGDVSYCGKRFTNSEDLLAHLKTHTSSLSEASANLHLLGAPGLPTTHPLFHRTYPTPPLSPLAAARYHPYSKPPLLPPSLNGFPLGHPGLSPYLNPYSIYGPRLGSTPGMHP